MCPRPVVGTIGKAKYCAAHRYTTKLQQAAAWYDRYRERVNERKKVAKRIDPRRAMTPEESGRRGGLASGPGRMRNLTPERRREIARMGALAAKARRAAARCSSVA